MILGTGFAINLRDRAGVRASMRTGVRLIVLLILLHSQMDIVTTTLNETQVADTCEFLVRQTIFVTFVFTLFGTVCCGFVIAAARELVAHSKRVIARSHGGSIEKLDGNIIRYYSTDAYTQRMCEIAGWNELLCKEGCRVDLMTCLTLVARQTYTEEPRTKECLTDLSNMRTLKQLKLWVSTYHNDENIMACVNNSVGLAYWCSTNERPDRHQTWRQGKAFTPSISKSS